MTIEYEEIKGLCVWLDRGVRPTCSDMPIELLAPLIISDVAPVLEAKLDKVAEHLAARLLRSVGALGLRESEAYDVRAVFQGNVFCPSASAATDFEQAHARFQLGLLRDEADLLTLSFPEYFLEGSKDSAQVRHRPPEDYLVEMVSDLAVVRNSLPVTRTALWGIPLISFEVRRPIGREMEVLTIEKRADANVRDGPLLATTVRIGRPCRI